MPSSDDKLAWSSWPARERPGAALAGLVAVTLFGVAGAAFSGNVYVGAGAGFALFCCLQRFYFPVRCTIDNGAAGTATVRTLLATRTMPLSSVRRVAHDGKALMLSSSSKSTAADVVRGFLLPLPRRGADAIIREALSRLGTDAVVVRT